MSVALDIDLREIENECEDYVPVLYAACSFVETDDDGDAQQDASARYILFTSGLGRPRAHPCATPYAKTHHHFVWILFLVFWKHTILEIKVSEKKEVKKTWCVKSFGALGQRWRGVWEQMLEYQ